MTRKTGSTHTNLMSTSTRVQRRKRRKLFILFSIAATIISLFLFRMVTNTPQDNRSDASFVANGAVLGFSPESSKKAALEAKVGDTIELDTVVYPKNNIVSQIQYEVFYDSSVLEYVSFVPSSSTGLTVLEGPLVSNGSIRVSFTAGIDPENSIRTDTSLAKITFRALNPTRGTSQVTYSQQRTRMLTLDPSSANQNMIADLLPAYVSIKR